MAKDIKLTRASLVRDKKKYEQMVTEIDKRIIAQESKYYKNEILCIILKEGKGSSWFWVNDSVDKFSYDGSTYFKVDSGTYHKGSLRFFIFLEGISLPIHHGYIEREEVTKKFKDKDTGKDKEIKLTRIKGLKFDSKVIDMLLNRHLADEFTKQHMDLPNLAIIILLVINFFLGIGSIVTNVL